jgi:Protein of unknown function (DUF2442)
MRHSIVRVTGFEVIGPHQLAVRFSDGTRHNIDFRPVLYGPLFGPLRDLGVFNCVVLDSEAGTLVWPKGADFDPSTLHDWPNISEELASRARAWSPRRAEGRATG